MKEFPKEAQEVIDQVMERVQQSMNSYIGKSNVTEAPLVAIKNSLIHEVSEVAPMNEEHIQFMVGEHPDEIVPANLYTALIMHLGAEAPTWEQCKDGTWTKDDGSEFSWKDGKVFVRVPLPLNQITVTFKASVDQTAEALRALDSCSQDAELFIHRETGKAALVTVVPDIDWDLAHEAFQKVVGVESVHDSRIVSIYHERRIRDVFFTEHLAGACGSNFEMFRFPGVPHEDVLICRHYLTKNRDVVGPILITQVSKWVEFDCPRKTRKP